MNLIWTTIAFGTLPPGLWETLFGWLPSTADRCSAVGGCEVPLDGALFYALVTASVVLLVSVVIHYAYEQGTLDSRLVTVVERTRAADSDDERDRANADMTETADESVEGTTVGVTTERFPDDVESIGTEPADGVEETVDSDAILDDIEDLHQRTIAPSGLRPRLRSIRAGEQHRQMLFATGYLDTIPDGVLRSVFTRPDLQFDMSIHISPRDRQRAKRAAERRAESLEADAEIFGTEGGGQFMASDKQEEARRTAAVRDAINDGDRPADVSLYVSPRGEDADALRDQVDAMRKTMADAPANIQLRTIAGEQDRALQSVAPVGKDVLAAEADWDPTRLMLGTGIGAMLGSATKSTLIEETGVEMGEHAYNGSPVIKDPFESETNYNWVVIGDSGSGKSYDVKLQSLRTVANSDETMLVILDPLQGFVGLSEALGAERITIGGDRGLNPLELRKPSDHTRTTAAADTDPLSAKIRDVMSFFENFAHRQGLELGGARTQLNSAVKAAYTRNGITHDVETHGKESPTIRDVLDVLEEMADEPEDHVLRTDEEAATVRSHATTLIGYLRPFVDGEYENLSQSSEFDLRDEDVVYLDLSQQEGSGGGSGLMMQLLFSLVYERAKETPKDVIFLIDEARYLMRDATSLEFLGQRVRHSRHFDTSIRFITQNIRDFFAHEEAESIINNSFIKILHRTEEIEEWADTFGLNDRQVDFVKTARTGDGGYSEALVEINGEWYPLQVFSNSAEDAVVDYDERTDEVGDLPGMDGERELPLVRAIQDRLRVSAFETRLADGTILDPAAGTVSESWTDLSADQQTMLDVLNRAELEDVLARMDADADSEALVQQAVREKLQAVREAVGADDWQAIRAEPSSDSDSVAK